MKNGKLIIDKDIMWTIVLTCLIAIGGLSHNFIFTIAIIVLLPFYVIKPTNAIAPLYFASLSSNYFVAMEGVGYNRLIAITVVIGFLIIILNRKTYQDNKNLVLICLIILAFFLSFLFAELKPYTTIVAQGLSFLMFFCYGGVLFSNEILNKIFKEIQISSMIIVFAVILDIGKNGVLISGRLSLASNVNTNNFAMMICQLAVISFLNVYFFKNKFMKILNAIFFIISCLIVFLSGSRSSFIALSLTLVLYFLITSKMSLRDILKKIFMLALIIIVGGSLFKLAMANNEELANRMNFKAIVESNGTGRMEGIVIEIKKIIPENFLFGIGPSTECESYELRKYNVYHGRLNSSHNIIVSLIAQWGMVGFLIHLILILNILKNLKKHIKNNDFAKMIFFLLIVAIINGIGEIIFPERYFWNLLAISALLLNTINYDQKDGVLQKMVEIK